jgi:N-methylhydantoinase B
MQPTPVELTAAPPRLDDTVTVEVISHRLSAAVQEMVSAIHRTARSPFVKEAMDFGVGITDAKGNMIAYPRGANTFAIDRHFASLVNAFDTLEPGDVIGTSDPYTSGGLVTHNPDLDLMQPLFHDGVLVGFAWCFAHLTDVGGAVPGSLGARLHDIFQEGIRFPPMKIIRHGRINPVFAKFFRANTRIPDINNGDFQALLASLAVAEKRMTELCARFGAQTVIEAGDRLLDYAAAKARAVLRKIPDGVHEFWDYLDDDLITPYPIRVRVRLTVHDGKVNIDLTGTDPQTPTSYNLPSHGRCHYWFMLKLTTMMLTHDRSIPLNSGIYRSISAVNPPGTILNAEFPDACGFRTPVCIRINDAVTGALISADDGLLPAPASGCTSTLVVSEYEQGSTTPTVKVITPMRGGMGAYRGRDGIDGRDVTVNNMRNHPIEVIERDSGILVESYDIGMDTGGVGQWRGGCGQRLRLRVTSDTSELILRGAERFRFSSWGVAGGGPGHPYQIIINENRPDERRVGKLDRIELDSSQTLTICMPGAAGFGDPLDRAIDAVARDVILGFVSQHVAETAYGVVFDPDGSIDPAKTAASRERLRRQRPLFDFGRHRTAWEGVFDDATMLELTATLLQLPKAVRPRRKEAFFRTALDAAPLETVAGWTGDDVARLRERVRTGIDTLKALAAQAHT